MWIFAAFQCFFAILFTGKLPASAARRLPAGAAAALPEASTASDRSATEAPAPKASAEPKVSEAPAPPAPVSSKQAHRDGALALLAQLQREGRLIDFLQESIEDYEDGDVGAAVRDIHRGCKKVLDQHLELEAVMPGEEDDQVKVPAGFDPAEVKLIGDTKGEPPFAGALRHHGWRATKLELPHLAEGVDRRILAPAEVELP